MWTLGARSATVSRCRSKRARTALQPHYLFDHARPTATRQRTELGATYNWADADNTALFDTSVTTINAAYVLRPQFATVRLSLSYVFQDRPEQAQQPIPPFPFN